MNVRSTRRSVVPQPYRSTKLHVKISEAKNLPSKDMNGFSDPYCILLVDDEVVARTTTVWRELNPFFGEEFFVDLAEDFQEIAVCVYDQDRGKSDDAIGKVSFSRRQMEEVANGIDSWHPLVKMCKETEVSGEVLVRLLKSETPTGLDHLTVTVVRARDVKETFPDLLAIVTLDGERQVTEKCKVTRSPIWGQSFTFERAKLGPDIRITLRSGSGLGTTFVGEAVVSLAGLQSDFSKSEWVRLRPRPKDFEGLAEGNGSLRLAMRYTHELILPLASYASLVGLVVASVQTRESIENGLVSILEELLAEREQSMSIMDREQVARTLIRILLLNNMCTPFLKLLNGLEIARCKEYSTLFRGNSIATKCTDQFMKIVGLKYLHESIKPVIDEIFREKKDCELDPTKLPAKGGKDLIQKHSLSLIRYLENMFTRIFESVDRCPHIMRLVFKHLQEGVRENKGAAPDASGVALYTVVSGFLFLRFLAPAVLSPKLFGIRDELADARTARTLTLLAKSLQIAGNLGTTIGSGKEAYMEPLYPTLAGYLDRVKSFIDRICSVRDKDEVDLFACEESTGLDTVLVEDTIPLRDHTSKSFKKKHVTLTSLSLTTTTPGKSDTETVAVSALAGVERIDASAVSQKHAIQLIGAGRPSLSLVLPSEYDANIWIQSFRQAMRLSSQEHLSGFHAGVIKDGKWTCCKGRGDDHPPCCKSHRSACVDQFTDNPGPEVWAHKLFAMLLACKSKLESKYLSAVVAEADKRRVPYVKDILSVVDDINLSHLLHQDAPVPHDAEE